jgi:hypothetical protein
VFKELYLAMTNRAISKIKKIVVLRLSFQVVFSKWIYVAIAIALAGIFWIIFNVFDQLLFFSPIFIFYLPDDAVLGFILSTTSAILIGIVVSMNVYVLKYSENLKVTIGSLFSGSTLSVISSTCASCSSVAFLLVSTFGGIGLTTSIFLSNYQVPLRGISIALLVWALYSVSNKLIELCMLDHQGTKNSHTL